VLLVDDSQITREMYSEYLSFRGFSTVSAPDGEAAIAMAHSVKPNVIVMDLAMPRLDGVGAIRRLKESARTRRIPVILLTGHAVQAIQRGAIEAGADVFLTKPCLPEDLEANVRRVIEGGAGRRS
jgi:CheY-like chemotaxis protein